MHEILVKVGDNTNPDPVKDKACYKDGDIILITRPSESKRVWDQMLERGRCTRVQYEAAQISPDVFKWPWGNEEKRVHQVFVIEEELTEEEILEMTGSETIYNGNDAMERPILTLVRRRKFKLEIDSLKHYSKGKAIKFSTDVIEKIRNKNMVVEPMYDKPIQKVEIRRKK